MVLGAFLSVWGFGVFGGVVFSFSLNFFLLLFLWSSFGSYIKHFWLMLTRTGHVNTINIYIERERVSILKLLLLAVWDIK